MVFPAVTLMMVALAGCVSLESVNNDVETMVGEVYVTGNEPFTKFALQLEDGSAYILKCSKELQDQLSREQGKTVKVRFKGIENALEGKSLDVVSIEALVK
jgi:uncharacterized Zn finger protein